MHGPMNIKYLIYLLFGDIFYPAGTLVVTSLGHYLPNLAMSHNEVKGT